MRAIQGKASYEEVDALRRALAENPPAAETEGERLAYFRGFLAACKRSKDEESRLLKFQDLLFRVASQLDGNLRYVPANDRFSYEEMVSIGYGAVLEVIRKKREPSRSDVAGAIRHRIVDAAREQFGYRENVPKRAAEKRKLRSGQRVLVGDDGDEVPLVEALGKLDAPATEGEILWDAIKVRAAKKFGPDSRFLDMLALRIQGLSLKEIGEKMGFTESRASQIFSEHQEWMERELAPLAAV